MTIQAITKQALTWMSTTMSSKSEPTHVKCVKTCQLYLGNRHTAIYRESACGYIYKEKENGGGTPVCIGKSSDTRVQIGKRHTAIYREGRRAVVLGLSSFEGSTGHWSNHGRAITI